MNTARCSLCKFWTGNRKDPKSGQCRRYPPAPAGLVPQPGVIGGRPQVATVFVLPDTVADHWCGEYSPEFLNG